VRHAFAAVGDSLVDTGFGALASPVTVLTTIKAHQGWIATVYVYPSVAKAGSSYRGNLDGWRSAGIATRQLRNLVVTVSAAGSHGRTPPPLPALVAKALDLVSSDKP
jgi:hypothetical protein